MLKAVLAVLTLLIGTLALVQPSLADGGSPGTKIRLEARMRSGPIEAKVSYRQEGSGTLIRRTVQAEIIRVPANTTFAIYHQGVQIGTLTTNALGVGNVEFSRNVPQMNAGDLVGVGDLTGTLVPR